MKQTVALQDSTFLVMGLTHLVEALRVHRVLPRRHPPDFQRHNQEIGRITTKERTSGKVKFEVC